jgi:hypothetical protein
MSADLRDFAAALRPTMQHQQPHRVCIMHPYW